MTKQTFSVNGATHTIDFSDKAKTEGVSGFYIKANRWFQSGYGNTYHSVKCYAVMADGSLGDVVASDNYAYGYGDHYLVTACQALVEAGYIDTTNEYALSGYQVQQALNIEHTANDVKRKKDL
tara:strand:+ start:86164 stop:86532 length:369 start_codon:yes stop_codon:yes gene_type:complete